MKELYYPQGIEKKWQEKWAKEKTFKTYDMEINIETSKIMAEITTRVLLTSG